MTARPLFKVDRDRRITDLKAEVERERALRLEAERNANRFHALLIAERIRSLPARVRS
jgi:hypothetical protein